MRLARMIALSSELSRRAAEKAIEEGLVRVNGEVVSVLATVVDPSKDRITLSARELSISPRKTYLAFNKPKGFMVTKSDPECRPTIWDLLGDLKVKLNSVGRLDFNSEGLIILTDDGDFINRLTHPRHEIWKTYRARVKGEPGDAALAKLRGGLMLSDGPTLPARVRRIDSGEGVAVIEISIREGRNRQVRRMFDKIGFPVVALKRVAIGGLKLGDMKPGSWRSLGGEEVASIEAAPRGKR